VYNDEGLRLEFERPKNTSLLKVVIYRVQTVCALSKKKIALYVSKTQTHSQLRDASDSTPTTTTIHSLTNSLFPSERGGAYVVSCCLVFSKHHHPACWNLFAPPSPSALFVRGHIFWFCAPLNQQASSETTPRDLETRDTSFGYDVTSRLP
jgi:hypothetical protein